MPGKNVWHGRLLLGKVWLLVSRDSLDTRHCNHSDGVCIRRYDRPTERGTPVLRLSDDAHVVLWRWVRLSDDAERLQRHDGRSNRPITDRSVHPVSSGGKPIVLVVDDKSPLLFGGDFVIFLRVKSKDGFLPAQE